MDAIDRALVIQELTREKNKLSHRSDGVTENEIEEYTKKMSAIQKFSSIEQFRSARRNVEFRAQFTGKLDEAGDPIMDRTAKLPTIKYIGTVKVHGCNAGVNFTNGVVTCQSRERVITPEDDNYGFARFVQNLPDFAKSYLSNIVAGDGTVYFEWAGKGIQTGVAVNQLDKFAIIIGARRNGEDGAWIDIQNIECAPNNVGIYNIYQFGYYELDIDFETPGPCINAMNDATLLVEKACPVGAFFGVSGVGEGIVWAPADKSMDFGKFAFKVKGSEHSNSKVKKLATVDVEKVASIQAFVDKHVSEERLAQAWNYLIENKLEPTEKSTGHFIKWVYNDILKEENDELAASGFAPKDISGAVATVARRWFFSKII